MKAAKKARSLTWHSPQQTGKAPPVVPNYGNVDRGKAKPAALGQIGPCQSCAVRSGKGRHISLHPGTPILCDKCADLRRARIEINRNLFLKGVQENA